MMIDRPDVIGRRLAGLLLAGLLAGCSVGGPASPPTFGEGLAAAKLDPVIDAWIVGDATALSTAIQTVKADGLAARSVPDWETACTEAELLQAVDRGEFELFYQPQVSLPDHRVIGAEALIRWRHPSRGMLPPAQFMPVVNTSAIANRVAGWVLETACRQAGTWERIGHGLRIGVNLWPIL
eukprot:gene2658-3615_t